MKALFLSVIICIIAFNKEIHAQDKFINNYAISMFFGVRDTKVDSFPNTQNVDFMNYLYDSHEGSDYQYIGFSGHFWFKNHWESDIKVAMYDDFVPDNLDITAQYFFLKNIAASFGLYTHSALMNDFTMFHKTTGEGLYGDLETNFRQRKLFDRGLQCGVLLKQVYGKFHASLKLSGGVSSFKPFSEVVLQKQIDGNFVWQIDYQTENTWNFFFFPDLRLNLDCFTMKKSKLGIQLQANYFYSEKSIDYTQTTYDWTIVNSTVQQVDSPKHSYRKFDLDFGLYLKW
jgi:hypothetical protein